jgi:hypothetical protein
MNNYVFHQTNSGQTYLIEENEMTLDIGQMIENHKAHRQQIIRLIQGIQNNTITTEDDICFKVSLYFETGLPLVETIVNAYNQVFNQVVSIKEVKKFLK